MSATCSLVFCSLLAEIRGGRKRENERMPFPAKYISRNNFSRSSRCATAAAASRLMRLKRHNDYDQLLTITRPAKNANYPPLIKPRDARRLSRRAPCSPLGRARRADISASSHRQVLRQYSFFLSAGLSRTSNKHFLCTPDLTACALDKISRRDLFCRSNQQRNFSSPGCNLPFSTRRCPAIRNLTQQ